MKKICILFLTMIFSLFIITSCGSDDPVKEKEGLVLKQVEDIDFDDDDMEEIPIENPDLYQNTYMDVDPDFAVAIQINASYLGETSVQNDIVATSSTGDSVELHYEFLTKAILSIDNNNLGTDLDNTDKTLVEVKAEKGYKRGYAYTISIDNNDNLTFFNKHESIRNIIFTVQADDSDQLKLNNDYPTYSFDKVSHFEGYGDYNTYLYYDVEIREGVNDIIIFSNEDEKIYVEILKKENENGLTKIYYRCPDPDKIYNEMNLHVNQKKLDMENDFHLREIEEIAEVLLKSDYLLINAYALADKYGFSPAVDKFLDKATVNFSFKPSGYKFELGIEISLTHEFESGWRLCASFKFKWTKEYVLSGDAKLDTFLGIPTGVSMNCSAGCDESFTFQFVVTFKTEKLNPGYVPDTPKDLDLSRAKRAVEELKDKWTEAEAFGYKNDKIVGDTLMINIGYISFHLGYVSIDIELYACLKLSANCTIGICYTYSSHQVIVNYSTSSNDAGRGGDSKSGMSPSQVSANVLDLSIAGNFNVEVFAKIRITFYITGLKFLASIGIDVDAGVYLDITGLGAVGYDFNAKKFAGNIGASLEFGFFFRVSLNVSLLWIWHNSWELFSAKAPLLKLGWASSIIGRSDTGTIELNKIETNIDDTNLLMLDTFDGISMSGVTKQYLYNKRITWLDSIFISNPIDYPLFKNFYTDNEHVTIKNGKIYVDSSIAETEGKIYIVINLTDDTPFTLEANFHYLSSDAKFVTFDGQNKTSYLPGQKIIFPDKVEHRNGYLFKGWEYNDTLINSIETYYMGDSDINFVSKYVLEGICLVKFYDGFNNLISEQYVEKGYSAIAPDETLRDKNMDGYTFIEYDICFDNVSSDLEIHAIYERKGEIL